MVRHPHNNPWAEKLLQVSLPDSGEAWTAMEGLLDREMPIGWKRDWRRWVLVILLLLLLIGVCNCPGKRMFRFHEVVSRTVPARSGVPSAGIPAVTSPGSGHAVSVGEPAHGGAVIPADDGQVVSGGQTARSGRLVGGQTVGGAIGGGGLGRVDRPSRGHRVHGDTGVVATVTGHRSRRPAGMQDTSLGSTPDDGFSGGNPGKEGSAKTPGGVAPVKGESGKVVSGKGRLGKGGTGKGSSGKERLRNEGSGNGSPDKATPGKVTPTNTTPAKATPVRDSVRKKPLTPPAPPKDDEEKLKKNGWMVGIGVNQFFPLGGQRQSTYNPNGITGTLSDYLPVPMIRYYFNPRLYIQLEAQFNTPQATKKNLALSPPHFDSAYVVFGQQLRSTASIQQLYYFNLPLSLHYRFFDKLDVGAGLQFSRLSNAIGNFDSTVTRIGSTDTINTKAIHSFKGDTLYHQLKTDELRFLIDVNYTWKHFIFGVRYNQALSNFISVQIAPGQISQGRNTSLQIYLRYILWDSRKKNAGNAQPKK